MVSWTPQMSRLMLRNSWVSNKQGHFGVLSLCLLDATQYNELTGILGFYGIGSIGRSGFIRYKKEPP